MAIAVQPISNDFTFGSRVSGLTRAALSDEAIRAQLRNLFEERGLIVFEGVEPSGEMQIALSNVFGPLKDHPVAAVDRVDQGTMPGVIDMYRKPFDSTIVEIDGVQLTGWLPWHFDHCYNDELNYAGVLRAAIIPPDGGLTCFCDGVDLYRSLSPGLRESIERLNIIYTLDLIFDHMRFGLPEKFRSIQIPQKQYEILETSKKQPRAIHPAVWVRQNGEKVLHVSPWMAVGVEGHEDPQGDALLQALCAEINEKAVAYRHAWSPTDMIIWDNHRMLHSVTGNDPQYGRRMQRTTIKGDYGLGYFENQGKGGKILEMTV